MEETIPPALPTLEITDERLTLGNWQADLNEVIATSLELRDLIRQARTQEAAQLLKCRCAEEQAALVALDAQPEEILSLTAMDESGQPGYARDVVDHIPSVVLTELVAPVDARMIRFNNVLLQTMSPATLHRAIDETLSPVQYHGYRGAISWEWLEAVASLSDANRIAELLLAIDETVLEEALIPRIDDLQLHELFSGNGVTVTAFRALAPDSAGVYLPSSGDEIVDAVLRRLYDAAPDLIARILRHAWERGGAVA
ncbi:MAG: hypothetical protein HN712_23565 [Gemmatimonadetes bacterium]|nr:hypothetical protein [Gemmatimonadota bacterium]